MRGDGINRAPSLLAAFLLHLAVLAGGLIVWPWFGKPIQIANVTAVTLVPSKAAPPPAAVKAPVEQEAAAPQPQPKPAPPKPPPPPPEPKPQPAPEPRPQPKPHPQPAPEPKPPPPAPKPSPTPKPKPTPKDESLDLLQLSHSLDRSAQPPKTQPRNRRDSLDLNSLESSLDAPSKPSAATRGAARLPTAPIARPDAGAEQATSDAAAAVGARLNRIWNKSCGVEGFRDLVIAVRFHLAIDGQLAGQPEIVSPPQPGNSVWVAAADRAKRAVNQAAPFNELPRQTYGQWKTFVANFDGKKACENQ